MTLDLIRELKKEYPDNPLILFGTSWGSVLAASAASRMPVLVDQVVVFGQVLNNLTFNEEVYQLLREAPLSAKEHRVLKEIEGTTGGSVDQAKFLLKLLQKYTDAVTYGKTDKKFYLSILRTLLMSPDYKFKDILAVFLNGSQGNERLLEELLSIDLSKVLSEISVPYLILQGENDANTSTKAIMAFVNEKNNPNLFLKIFPKCAHIPNQSGIDQIIKCLVNVKDDLSI